MYLPTSRLIASTSRLTVRYKKTSDSAWQIGHPLLRIHPEWSEGDPSPVGGPVDGFAGSLFDLTPGTNYDIELTLDEPGQTAKSMLATATTRALPAIAGAANKTANPSNLRTVLNGLNPGDVVELDNGAYNNVDFYVDRSGTSSQPIYIRGKSRTGVVVTHSSRVIQLRTVSHMVIENMTLQGTGVDSGTAASSRAVEFYSGNPGQSFVTFRDLDVVGVDVGIIANDTINSILIYNCKMTGNNTWNQADIESNATWNDDGIRCPGEGNAVFDNTMHGFGDCFSVAGGIHSAAVYYYRNLVTMTGDDAFEGDYSTRNIGFYDNHITNCGTLLSCDPVYGGPLYCFRNIAINTMRGPYKLNATNSGFLIYNNTVVRTEGRTGWAWNQGNNGPLRNWAYRNNVLIYRGANLQTLAMESSYCDPMDFSNNAWFPNGKVWWTNSGNNMSFNTVTEAIANGARVPITPVFSTSTKRHDNDVLTVSNPFVPTITLGATHLTEITTTITPTIAGGSAPKNSGTPIAGVTDGYSGGAPDMGAIISGRTTPRWGALR
jgi:hypothetical protein